MTEADTDTAPLRARDVARAHLTAAITDAARRHLVENGAAGLSLRAVSRDLGMASSAIYRYFPSRDALLTQLIIDAYDSLGASVEAAEAEVDRADLGGRFRAIAHAVRAWALANPHEYALIYGSPVPGYAAPTDTIDPATRVTVLLVQLLADGEAAGLAPVQLVSELPEAVVDQLSTIVEVLGRDVDRERLFVGVGVWVQLYGLVTFELFGQFKNIFDDALDLFTAQVEEMAARMGLDP